MPRPASQPEPTPSRSLIVGATGQVGALLLAHLTAQRGADAVLAAGRRVPTGPGELGLDLARLAHPAEVEALLDDVALDAVFCIAGMTNVDGCEDQPELALHTNMRGPGLLAGYAERRGLPFVYLSTEYIFAGRPEAPGPYAEDAPAEPLNVYGHSKLRGEHAVQEAHGGALVLRTTVVYGPDPQGKNYLAQLRRNLAAGRPMRVPEDQISTPTYNRDLIRAMLGLVEAGATGVFHVCGPERMDRLRFAREAARALGLDGSLLEGVSTAELGQRAVRPLAAGLHTAKLTGLYPALRPRTVSEALAECAGEMLEHAGHDRPEPMERPALVRH